MAIVFVPPKLQSFTNAARVEVDGDTVREVIDNMGQQFPGVESRLLEDGRLAPPLQLAVDNVMTRVLSTAVTDKTEVHFLPAIGGG